MRGEERYVSFVAIVRINNNTRSSGSLVTRFIIGCRGQGQLGNRPRECIYIYGTVTNGINRVGGSHARPRRRPDGTRRVAAGRRLT
jgi:hypothetical protein